VCAGLVQEGRDSAKCLAGNPRRGDIEGFLDAQTIRRKYPPVAAARARGREQQDGQLVASRREQGDVDAEREAARRARDGR
jgi:hypothetical protein